MANNPVTSPTPTGESETLDIPDGGGGGDVGRGVKALYSRKISTTTRGTNHTYLYSFKLVEIDGSDGADFHRVLDEKRLDIDESTLADSDAHVPSVPIETRVEFRPVPYDAGDAINTGWIECYVNGVLRARLSPTDSVHPNSSGQDFGGDATTAGSTWCGIACEGGQDTVPSGTPSALPAQMFGARFIRPQEAVTPPINPGSADVVAFTVGAVDGGTLNIERSLSPFTLTASGLTGREVQCATMLTTITAISASPRTYVIAVDGIAPRIIDPIGKTCNLWTNTTGTAPFTTCRIVGVWRGRVLLANYDGNPSFYALSKVVRASNDLVAADLWTTGGTDPTRAFRGDATDTPGAVASAVTAFAAIDNGRAFLGCASECYIFDDDPGYGGRLLRVQCETGCVGGPRSVGFDEEGNVYFLGPAGLYMIPYGTRDGRNVTGNRLAAQLNNVNTATTQVQLVYDSAKRTMMVFLTPRDLRTPGVHGVLDTAQNAPWLDELPVRFGPTAVCKIAGEAGDDRRYLIGGVDGYIRRPVRGKRDDDGDPIDAWVAYPAIEMEDATRKVMVYQLQGAGSVSSGPAEWSVWAAASAAEVLAKEYGGGLDPAASGTWFGTRKGFQPPVRLRVNAGCVQFRVRQDSASDTFSMERVVLMTKDGGPRRA